MSYSDSKQESRNTIDMRILESNVVAILDNGLGSILQVYESFQDDRETKKEREVGGRKQKGDGSKKGNVVTPAIVAIRFDTGTGENTSIEIWDISVPRGNIQQAMREVKEYHDFENSLLFAASFDGFNFIFGLDLNEFLVGPEEEEKEKPKDNPKSTSASMSPIDNLGLTIPELDSKMDENAKEKEMKKEKKDTEPSLPRLKLTVREWARIHPNKVHAYMETIIKKGENEALTARLVSVWKAYGHYTRIVDIEEKNSNGESVQELQFQIRRGYFTRNTISELTVLNQLYDFCPGFSSPETSHLLLGAPAPTATDADREAKAKKDMDKESSDNLDVEMSPEWMDHFDNVVLFLVRAKRNTDPIGRIKSGPDAGSLVSKGTVSTLTPAAAAAGTTGNALGGIGGGSANTSVVGSTGASASIELSHGKLGIFNTVMEPVFRSALAKCKTELQRKVLIDKVYQELESKFMLDMLLDSKTHGCVVGFILCHHDSDCHSFNIGRLFLADPFKSYVQLKEAARSLHELYAKDQQCGKIMVYMPSGGNARSRSVQRAIFDDIYTHASTNIGKAYVPAREFGLDSEVSAIALGSSSRLKTREAVIKATAKATAKTTKTKSKSKSAASDSASGGKNEARILFVKMLEDFSQGAPSRGRKVL